MRIGSPPLDRLARTVAPALAERWVRWIAWAEQDEGAPYKNPRGLAVYTLSRDPTEEPPDDVPGESAPEFEPPAEPEAAQDDGAETPAYAQTCEGVAASVGDVWHDVLRELKLQMTRATFDTWVRSTHALGYEGETLVVQVASAYAKEWLENRLAVTVVRTLGSIAGRELAIRYEARDAGCVPPTSTDNAKDVGDEPPTFTNGSTDVGGGPPTSTDGMCQAA